MTQWKKSKAGAPRLLVAVAKGSGIILAVFEIDNRKWAKSKGRYTAVPLKDKNEANARRMQGKVFTGDRRGGMVIYGSAVA